MLFTALTSLAVIALAEAPPLLQPSICVAAPAHTIATNALIREAGRIGKEVEKS